MSTKLNLLPGQQKLSRRQSSKWAVQRLDFIGGSEFQGFRTKTLNPFIVSEIF